MKRILFYFGHPAHYHLFKNVISAILDKNYKVNILIKKKDVLEELMQQSGFGYENILPEGRKDNKISMAVGVVKRSWRLIKYCIKNRPDILIGTSAEIGHVGSLLSITSINVNEEDFFVGPLYSKVSYPYCSHILSPDVCNNGKWEKKSVKYVSYHELAYLHPNNFSPDKDVVRKYIPANKKYFLLRFVKFGAHHDSGIKGITDELALKIINILKPYGNIVLTSERKIDPVLEPYKLKINPMDMHHMMAFSELFIGDSQTMAAEAGVLGVPFIHFNDFAGRIGYLNDIENKYELGYGINSNHTEILLEKVKELVEMPNRGEIFQKRREKMLSEKIDVTAFMVWFIENYPNSFELMKKYPDYQYKFK